MTAEEGWFSSVLSRFLKEKTTESSQNELTNERLNENFNLFSSRIKNDGIESNQPESEQHQYLWNKQNFVKDISISPGASTAPQSAYKQPTKKHVMDAKMKRDQMQKDTSQEELVPREKKLSRSMSVAKDSKLLSMMSSRKTSAKKLPRPVSAFSRLSTQSQPFSRTPVHATTHSNISHVVPLPSQVDEGISLKSSLQKVPGVGGRRHSQPIPLRRPQSGPSSSRKCINSSTSLQQTFILMESQPRNSDADSNGFNNQSTSLSKKSFKISSVSPIYDRSRVAPTPFATDASTPILETDGEKKVRFLESEVVGERCSRPSSAVSTYSNILKNSARFSFTSNEAGDIYGVIGHTPRICSCPCHFFPKMKQNTGVQVLKADLDALRPPRPPPRPRNYRLFVVPTLAGLENMPLGSKFTSITVRALLSQVGLGVVIFLWWIVGALIFSTIEGPLQHGHLERMSSIRANLVIDLATELRQVKPYDSLWRTKIEEYMIRLETAVLLAVKSGYTSNAVKWSFSESFLYSFSLTSLLGPGGLFIQSPLTRIFSLLYSVVGIPIFFILLFNVCQTIREGLTWLWLWRRRRKRISVASSAPSTDEHRGAINGGVNPTALEVGAQYMERPVSSRDFAQLIHISKVQALDNNLPCSRRSSSVSSDVRYESVPQASKLNAGASSSTSNPYELSSSSAHPIDNTIESEQVNLTNPPMPNLIQRPDFSLYQRRSRKESVPWVILAILPIFYLVLSSILLVTAQKWSIISALFVIGNNLLFIDHGGLDNKRLFNSGIGTIIYTISALLGVIVSFTFILGVWPKIKSSLGEAGRNLYVVKPICLAG